MTDCRVIISDEALADLQLQSSWYAESAGSDIAERYLKSFDETLAAVAKRPDLGRPRHFEHEMLSGLRSFAMAGAFHTHLVFYHYESDLLRIFRVMRGMRDLPRRLLEAPGAE
ncbi:MAG: type II toxin-antitoxin system RelE/ParE family toxin [Prosthecobacter sp.]|uniref:type II toxin-antitoxin system RelE/ParE family toxin n=1 Tax=Prosthecobacter sp. TaxID=1965333 RepID=UPI00261C4172|nr:type II toxin-antitoxin system RelE/ParE family toxin [Prosthecobacter sp.]MCF7788519.1 type II toxin-antitoxin system RelE/ParE family toxin [Prosthecobacter sp.]